MLPDPAQSAASSFSTENSTAAHQQTAYGVSLNTPSRRRNKPGESLSRRERGRRPKAYTSFNSLPKELQSNQYIVSGYRLQLSAWESIKSVFGLHNETGNIWSHLLGQCLMLKCGATSVKLTTNLYQLLTDTPQLCRICIVLGADFGTDMGQTSPSDIQLSSAYPSARPIVSVCTL